MGNLVYDEDIEDADVWVAKALLMGAKLTHTGDTPSEVRWRWLGYADGHVWPLVHADWPGRCAKLMVEEMQRMERVQHEESNLDRRRG